MPAWVPRWFLRTFDQEVTGSLRGSGLQTHSVMSFVAPEVVVLSVSWSGVHVCVCTCVHSCGGLLYGRVGAASKPIGALGWAAAAASVWALQSLKSVLGRTAGWGLGFMRT